MANLIQNNSKLIEKIEQQKKSQINTQDNAVAAPPTNKLPSNDDFRNPRTVAIIKDQSGFGFNVRGQISGEF